MADVDLAEVYRTLGNSHMRGQVASAAQVQRALALLWDRTVDPSDFAASFDRFRDLAVPLIQRARGLSEDQADLFYDAFMARAGYAPSALSLAREVRSPEVIRASLGAAVGRDYADFRIRRGGNAAEIAAAAKVAMLRSAKRQVLQAGRARVIRRSIEDPNVLGWARVSDGAPCSFCAMLVSRGPVYSAASSTFRAHDGCGCNARPIPRNDPSRGWDPEAREARDLYRAALEGRVYRPGSDEPLSFRQAIEARARGVVLEVNP